MSFIPENRLEEVLVTASHDPSASASFYRTLIDADVYILPHDRQPEEFGRRQLEEGEMIQLLSVTLEGKDWIPFFSSLPRVEVVLSQEAPYMCLNARAFMEITQGADLVLNPGSDYGKFLPHDEVAAILDGSILNLSGAMVIPAGTRLLVGEPANYPHELVAVLKTYFAATPSVKRAFLSHFSSSADSLPPHTLIAVEATENWEDVLEGASRVIQGVDIPDPPVDFVRVSDDQGIKTYTASAPFYKKKRLGVF